MTLEPLDVVVLNTDVKDHGLKRGDVGAVVNVQGPDAVDVEFVTAAGRTKAVVTLSPRDLRSVEDNDLLAVRPATPSGR